MEPTWELVLGNKPKDHVRARLHPNLDERARGELALGSGCSLHPGCA